MALYSEGEGLRRWDLIEMKNISIDRARCDESDDMSFNQNSRSFTTENMSFPVVLYNLSRIMKLERREKGENFEVGALGIPITHSILIVF